MRQILALSAAFSVLCTAVSAQIFPDAQNYMLCKIDETKDRPALELVLYVSGKFDDGRFIYQSLGTAPLSVTVNQDGSLEPTRLKECRFPEQQ